MDALAKTETKQVLPIVPADPPAAAALGLLRACREADGRGLIVIADNERRAADLASLLRALDPGCEAMVFPPWDCLPHDRLLPSAAVMGRRAAVLARLSAGDPPDVLVATPEALVQRVPARLAAALAPLDVRSGSEFDEDELIRQLESRGYWSDERVDEAGEYSARGGTFDLFPADAENPVRIEHEEGRITSIRTYDALSQRSIDEVGSWRIVPARETPAPVEESAHPARSEGELRLLAGLMPEAVLVLDPRARDRALGFLDLVQQAASAPLRLHAGERALSRPDLYADAGEMEASLAQRPVIVLSRNGAATVPRFATQRDPQAAFARFVREERESGRRIVLAAPDARVLARFARAAGRATGEQPRLAGSWAEASQGPAGEPAGVVLPAAQGFRDEGAGLALVTAFDLLGSRAVSARPARRPLDLDLDADWQVGDAVVHEEHGVAILRGLEQVQEAGPGGEMIRLQFAGDEVMMLPVSEAGALWRYGSAGAQVKPDTLHGTAWKARRDRVAAEIQETADKLARLAKERQRRRVAPIEPPASAYERFAARFPYPETPDQASAIAAVLEDLRSGRPMDRLVCGDVGFGKTEVALRAAAAVALAGRQVALAAPTTVLARQHAATFRKRFAGLGIRVAELSRFVPPAEARETKEGLASGEIPIVIGTHAVAGKGVRFADLALVVIDEEQRFGERHKATLRRLAGEEHVLAMTATPIPRTLESALSGLRELSVIATPPVARRPVRTALEPFVPEILADALLREKARGGQSFVVCPTIEDLGPMGEAVAAACPGLDVLRIHAKLPPAEIDEAMLRFADGDGDCLLSTNIVESGLDVPNANTMVVWRPDRFGLAQLHQLRGRVGRGRASGICVLMSPDPQALTGAARRRLQTLVALDRPGAGFAISARDLDLRGAGDLFGEDQSGRLTLIGSELARHLAEQALRRARGEEVQEDWMPEIAVGDPGHVPQDYVPEEEARLNLYVRLARLRTAREVADLVDEVEDRFGPPPEPVERLLGLAGIAAQAKALDVDRIDIGPNGVAAATRGGEEDPPAWFGPRERMLGGAPIAWKKGRLVWARAGEPATDLPRAAALLAALEHLAGKEE